MGIFMHRIRRPNIGSSNYWSTLFSDWLIYDLEIVVLHWSDGITQDSSNSKRNVWTLVIRKGSTHWKIAKTAMFNRRPMGSLIVNIFQSNLFWWFTTKSFKIKSSPRDHTGAHVSLVNCQSRSNFKWTPCILLNKLLIHELFYYEF